MNQTTNNTENTSAPRGDGLNARAKKLLSLRDAADRAAEHGKTAEAKQLHGQADALVAGAELEAPASRKRKAVVEGIDTLGQLADHWIAVSRRHAERQRELVALIEREQDTVLNVRLRLQWRINEAAYRADIAHRNAGNLRYVLGLRSDGNSSFVQHLRERAQHFEAERAKQKVLLDELGGPVDLDALEAHRKARRSETAERAERVVGRRISADVARGVERLLEAEAAAERVAGYQVTLRGDRIEYSAADRSKAVFADLGDRVRVLDTRDEHVAAALKVALEKFDGTQIRVTGTEEQRAQAVRVAVALGVAERIRNPELRDVIRAEQRRQVQAEAAEVARPADWATKMATEVATEVAAGNREELRPWARAMSATKTEDQTQATEEIRPWAQGTEKKNEASGRQAVERKEKAAERSAGMSL